LHSLFSKNTKISCFFKKVFMEKRAIIHYQEQEGTKQIQQKIRHCCTADEQASKDW